MEFSPWGGVFSRGAPAVSRLAVVSGLSGPAVASMAVVYLLGGPAVTAMAVVSMMGGPAGFEDGEPGAEDLTKGGGFERAGAFEGVGAEGQARLSSPGG